MKTLFWLLCATAIAYNVFVTAVYLPHARLWLDFFPPVTLTAIWWYAMSTGPILSLLVLSCLLRRITNNFVWMLCAYAAAFNAFGVWLNVINDFDPKLWLTFFPPLTRVRFSWYANRIGPTATFVALLVFAVTYNASRWGTSHERRAYEENAPNTTT